MRAVFRFLCLILVFAMLFGCGAEENGLFDTLCVDVSSGKVTLVLDTHGGFHGDGQLYQYITFSDNECLSQIEESSVWHPLPMSENVTALCFGIEKDGIKTGPYLNWEEVKDPLEGIASGYYFFLDRHSQAVDPTDDGSVLTRGSFNYTLAVYDSDTHILHYIEVDT